MTYYYTHKGAMRVARKFRFRVKNQLQRTDSDSDMRRDYGALSANIFRAAVCKDN